ncbi:NACHT domain-containing protein [Streptomyces cavernicola]|uniref:NACHT domain-containing protein n=1 Tax=Streptomyces cavernicola TaxID=3043613 RepID=A0ABT6S7H7_9ACTN|nr:NACHT domain-containing protein [Streptomyces sp. B-S-A6]MDI3403271.1 NACHT domain-containing protein [Streptomyces sp. B-S-A6]
MLFVMGKQRAHAWVWGLVCVVATGVAVMSVLPVKWGDADPFGAGVGLPSLVSACLSGWMSWRTLRHQERDVVAMAGQFAVAVRQAESNAWARLLGGDSKTIDVRFESRPAMSRNAAGAAAVGRLSEVASYYRRLQPGRLVITGAPGAGKTVLAVELILALLQDRKPDDPVPVRLPLASWATLPAPAAGAGSRAVTGNRDPDAAAQAVRAWVCRHLVDTYSGISSTTATALMDAGLILPVLDGLDELAAEETPGYGSPARQALSVLNGFQQGRAKANVVLTCRSEQYEALEAVQVWAQDAARIEITQVSPAQVRRFVHERVENTTRWEPLLYALERAPSSALARAFCTPWRLTLAVTVYEQRDEVTGAYLCEPQDLLDPALGTDRAVRDHLLGLFVLATTARRRTPSGRTYAPEQVRAWLGVLATYLSSNTATGRTVGGRPLSGTDLVPHDLWPLIGARRPRIVEAVLVAMTVSGVCALGMRWSVWGFDAIPVLILFVLPLFIALLRVNGHVWIQPWPDRPRVGPRQLRAPRARWRTASLVVAVLLTGLGYVLVLQIQPDDVVGLSFLLMFGLLVWLMIRPGGRVDAVDIMDSPRSVVVAELTAALLFGVPIGVLFGGMMGPLFGVLAGVGVGLLCGLGGTGVRYLALLLCTRRGPQALPWRLRRFLHWATEAGLLRVAGTAYQFRHRELQDWLADLPTSPDGRPAQA